MEFVDKLSYDLRNGDVFLYNGCIMEVEEVKVTKDRILIIAFDKKAPEAAVILRLPVCWVQVAAT